MAYRPKADSGIYLGRSCDRHASGSRLFPRRSDGKMGRGNRGRLARPAADPQSAAVQSGLGISPRSAGPDRLRSLRFSPRPVVLSPGLAAGDDERLRSRPAAVGLAPTVANEWLLPQPPRWTL